MERIGQAFSLAGCEVRLSAPGVEADPPVALAAEIQAFAPDLIGFSVRNVDDTLIVRGADGEGPLDTTFYLDEVKALVDVAVAALGVERVLAGGAAVGAGPEPVLRFLGLRFGITGAAEDLCWRIGRALVRGEGLVWPDDPRVIDVTAPRERPRGFGKAWRPPPGPTPRMGPFVRLTVARGSRIPVQMAHGCDRRCVFCVEARTMGFSVVTRPPAEVVAEVRTLYNEGVRRFWLTTSELNVPDERHALEVLRGLKGMKADFRVYLQAAPVSEVLLDALEDVGIDPTGLNFEWGHLSDRILRAGGGPANLAHLERLVELFLRRGYRQIGGSILFGAHWLETWDTVDEAVQRAMAWDRAFPDGIGLAYACGGRLYPETGLAAWVAEHRDEAAPHLYGEPDPTFVRPVVFCRPASPRALLRHVQAATGQAKGPIAPMNAETPASPDEVEAERQVNRAIWRLSQGQPAQAVELLQQALAKVPGHLEALRQTVLVTANELGDPTAAHDALKTLSARLGPDDPRQAEIREALRRLS
jgi:hypothetical protein